MNARGIVSGLVLALVFGALGCESGPRGPGTLTARVEGGDGAVGAVVVELEGDGIRDYGSAGDARVHGRPVGPGGRHRVVLAAPAGSELVFDVDVEDQGAAGPSAVVVEAADTANRLLPSPGDLRVVFER